MLKKLLIYLTLTLIIPNTTKISSKHLKHLLPTHILALPVIH